MPNIYKFMHKADVHHLLGGKLMFKDFRTYQTGEYPIGDAGEGNFLQLADNYSWKPADGKNPFGPGMTIETPLHMDNLVFSNEVYPTLISSYSVGNFAQLSKAMLHNGPEKYDAAVEILDSQTLLNAIYTAGRFVANGELCRLTCQPSGDRIQYVDIQTPDVDGHLGQLIFRKRPEYQSQREYRMILRETGQPTLGDTPPWPPVFVQLPAQYLWLFRQVA